MPSPNGDIFPLLTEQFLAFCYIALRGSPVSSIHVKLSRFQYPLPIKEKKTILQQSLPLIFLLAFWQWAVMPCNQRKTYTGHLLATHWRLLAGSNLCGRVSVSIIPNSEASRGPALAIDSLQWSAHVINLVLMSLPKECALKCPKHGQFYVKETEEFYDVFCSW